MEEMNEARISAETRDRVGEARRALLHLHKTLLEDERAVFESVRGPIASSGQFLQLVLHDERFAYLRPLSALVVQIDELLDADEGTEREAEALIAQAGELLRPGESGTGGLGEKYTAALQRSPEVVMAHAAAVKQLNIRRGREDG